MAIQRYAVLDQSSNVVNFCQWDGVSTWAPGFGLTVRPALPSDQLTVAALALPDAKAAAQVALDTLFSANFDIAGFIRGGAATGITGAGIGNFLATITNNYRTLRASIAAAPNVAALNAINIYSGWPANP